MLQFVLNVYMRFYWRNDHGKHLAGSRQAIPKPLYHLYKKSVYHHAAGNHPGVYSIADQ